jgi:ribonuclease M5
MSDKMNTEPHGETGTNVLGHKPAIREVILVEGKYDKNTLSQVVDATIVTTDGFGLFRDRERLAFFRRLAQARGLIVFTDSDGAGFVIRNFLKGAIPAGQLKQA